VTDTFFTCIDRVIPLELATIAEDRAV